MHPPLLYLGYVGFSITFSFAVAALIDGRIDAAWARWVRPWTLVAWMFLTARHRHGLLLGLLRARLGRLVVLGPGGERLASCRGSPAPRCCTPPSSWRSATRSRCGPSCSPIIAFSLSLIGTFLVRSGVLTSVHTFANDPARGVFILMILVLFIGGAFALFAWRARAAQAGRPVRAGLARRRARAQQPVPHHRLRDRVRRHALSARARGVHRREDLGRRAVLQRHLRPADDAGAARNAVRPAARVEARRSPRRRAAPRRRLRDRR